MCIVCIVCCLPIPLLLSSLPLLPCVLVLVLVLVLLLVPVLEGRVDGGVDAVVDEDDKGGFITPLVPLEPSPVQPGPCRSTLIEIVELL